MGGKPRVKPAPQPSQAHAMRYGVVGGAEAALLTMSGVLPPEPAPQVREVWLSRDPEGRLVNLWRHRPELRGIQDEDAYWCTYRESHYYVPADVLDIDVPTDRPIKVRIHVEVVDE